MIVDESVAIQGSGNQDTQSWYHSQEVNVMIDSPVVCGAWREAIERNQNTARFGRTRDDGCWYDARGTLAKGSYGTSAGSLAWATGLVGALRKAQGNRKLCSFKGATGALIFAGMICPASMARSTGIWRFRSHEQT
nr:hypothetical protein CFP56_78353 [Quercus suber]